MVETRDVLIKAAEDVQQGMWCRGKWFADELDEETRWASLDPTRSWAADELLEGDLAVGAAQEKYRCAEGSIALATAFLGGNRRDYDDAKYAVEATLKARVEAGQIVKRDDAPTVESLYDLNDYYLPDDPFEAGQQLAELFRTTAESL